MSLNRPIDTIGLAETLLRIGGELGRCQTILSRIEGAVEKTIRNVQSTERIAAAMGEMQQIDLLAQTLADLEISLQSIAATSPVASAKPISIAAVVHRLRLVEVSNRLSGHIGIPAKGNDFEIF